MSDVDLFSYVDNNAIGGTDNSRYLDYHLVIKNADLSDEFVVWTNQEVVEKKGVKISDFAGVDMLTANITSIGPSNVLTISNITPAITDTSVATANTTGSAGTIQINTSVYNLENGDTVGFAESQPSQFTFNTTSEEQVTVTENATVSTGSNVASFTANANLTLANVKFNSNSTIIPISTLEAAQYANTTTTASGTEYMIINVGTTNFNTVGATGTPAVGDIFTANVSGALTGNGIVAATTGVTYINESNITFPNSVLEGSGNQVNMTFVDNNLLKLTVANIHQSGANIVQSGRSIELISSNTTFNGQSFTIQDVGEHFITIRGDNFPLVETGNVEVVDVATLNITGFKYNNHSNLHTNEYTISNVTSSGITVYDANVTANIEP